MSSLNKIILIGPLETTPEVRVTNAGDQFAKFTIKANRPERSDGVPVQFDIIDIVAWRQIAEQAATLQQGDSVLIEGRIVTRTTEDEAGRKKYFTEVEARELRPLSISQTTSTSSPTTAQSSIKPSIQKKQVEEIQESDFDFGPAKTPAPSPFAQAPDNETDLDEEVPF